MLRSLVKTLLGSADNAPNVSVQRRRAIRLRHRVSVECRMGSTCIHGELLDIGESGLRLELPTRVAVGSQADVRYLGSLKGTFVQTMATVRFSWCCAAGPCFQAGAFFEEPSSALAHSWVTVLLRQLVRSARLSDDRHHVRCPAAFPATLSCPPSPQILEWGVLRDLSVGGALYEGGVNLPAGTAVEIALTPDRWPQMILPGCVVRRPRGTEGRFLLGLRFTQVAEAERKRLDAIVRESLRRWARRLAAGS